jgi:cytochrome P450
MAFWNLVEVYKDRELLSRVLPELQTAVVSPADQDPSEPLQFDLSPVLASPLLQSIYAEVLRMRISLMVTRMPDRGDFKYGPWTFKHNSYIALPSAYIGYHGGAWAPHTKDGKHPVNKFWAERFLVPSDEEADKQDSKKIRNSTTEKTPTATKMKFSTEHVEGIWTPYGGGALMCPGRHLAKQEMMGGVTVFAAYYDLEVADGWVPKMNPFFYGMGAQQPSEPTPVRIRRRKGGWKTKKQ